MGEYRLFNDGWEFKKQPLDDPKTPVGDLPPAGSEWAPVEIPHDWLIYDANNLYENSVGWYRKSFELPAIGADSIALRFEGVYMDSTLFVNGAKAGEWKNGYTSFEIDISVFLKPGRNEALMRVVHRAPNSRWYSGAGIYRRIWLKRIPADRIVSDGVYISTSEGPECWRVDATTELAFRSAKGGASCVLRQTVIDGKGKAVASIEGAVKPAAGIVKVEQALTVRDPDLWDLESPSLYSLKNELVMDGKVADSEIQSFGFRTIDFTPDRGFFLNGKRVALQGVCHHHDLGCLGAAVNKTALRRQLTLLKEMGVNAIRSAHNPPAVEFMELTDEMGILVESELSDIWEEPKTEFDYARFFPEWVERDLAAWIRRDRNHPSVIMWSLGNEIHDCHAGERGLVLSKRLNELALSHDPRQNARATLSSNYMPWEGAQRCAQVVKLAGYNYGTQYYAKHHADHPDWIIYGSETASIVQSRGVYHFPLSRSILDDDDNQCSSLGNSAVSWGAKNFESGIVEHRDAEFCLGQFIWTGFDYLGEPTPYHSKNSFFGQIDTCGFPKDAFYAYQAEWADYRKKPMIHIFPYWDFNEGQLIDLRVCSNAPSVELFLDGVSLGRKAIDHAKGQKLIADYSARFRPAELRAVAYDDSGRAVAEERKTSFGDAAALALKADKTELLADGSDLVFVEISAVDAAGRPVENATNRVEVKVSGAGRLIGLDNGDSADYDQFKGTTRRLFSGKLLAVVTARLEPGELQLTASSKGLDSTVLSLTVKPCPRKEGVSLPIAENAKSAANDEIPVRKIAIACPSGTSLNKGMPQAKVRAEIMPANASYRELEWRVTDDSGVDSPIAKVEPRGNEARLTAIADGRFRLRCSSRNGADGIRLISQLEFDVSGIGKAFLDPYGFVAGALYDASNAELGNGNEHGVSTLREGESQVGFRNVDFGSFGSDEVVIPIFELDGRPLLFRIWEGMPGEPGSELLADAVYDKKTIWNTYQEQTFKLARRIRGLATLCFVTDHKAHIKGFRFTRLRKAFTRLWAAENDKIYGDDFRVSGKAIERIGNNVTLEFGDMDFGEKGSAKIRIRGKSLTEKNSIHIRFSGDAGDLNQIAEFQRTDQVVEKEFPFERIRGRQRVSFVFLPGSSFDFESFEFLEG
jgi:beta-galactosidase